ncbi:hypothetical protein BT69DRAFT_342135 [Atractiella rhizophila]|nr:hypothetical protein BT69DRAFT_342135 [Atractiella rhizophila]
MSNVLRDAKIDPSLYIDPSYFYLHEARLMKNADAFLTGSNYDMLQWSLKRHISCIWNKIELRSLTAEEAQSHCSEIMQLCRNFRHFRERYFQLISRPQEDVHNREYPLFRHACGDENFTVSVFVQCRESKIVFSTASLLSRCQDLFPEKEPFRTMFQEWMLACDQQVHLIFDLLNILLSRYTTTPQSLLTEKFSGKVHALFDCFFSYHSLVPCFARFPDRHPLIWRSMKILKHLSFFQKDTADHVTAFEADALSSLSVEVLYSPTISVSTVHSIGTMGPQPPSPTIHDFSTTISALIAYESES